MLITLISIIMFSFIFLRFYKNKKALNIKKKFKFSRENLYKWMNLTKQERFDLSKSESNFYLRRRQNLLEKIRKEYKDIAKK